MAVVLVVEDNSDLRGMYAELLTMGGHEAVPAETVEEALAALRERMPDVVLFDSAVAGDLAALLAALQHRHVILASGARDLPERAAAMGVGAFLQKPFTPEQLLATVDRVRS